MGNEINYLGTPTGLCLIKISMTYNVSRSSSFLISTNPKPIQGGSQQDLKE